jgi:hypothetical protein
MWLKRVELIKSLAQNPEVIIEKSPPNLVRIDRLTQIFPNHSIIAFNRNPYANCSSILHRHAHTDTLSEKERSKIVSSIAGKWIARSSWVKYWIQDWNLKYFTYEKFCNDPQGCVSKIATDVPPLQTADVKKKIKVKDYKWQGIKNFNEQQISKLSQKEIDAISSVLMKDRKLVSFFDYEIL